jgi:hypothetical protein
MKFHCFLVELKISNESFLVSRILTFFFGEDWFSLQPDLCIGAWQRLHGVLSQEKKGGSIGFQAQVCLRKFSHCVGDSVAACLEVSRGFYSNHAEEA